MRLRTLASIAAALLLPVLLSSPASAYDMGAPDTPVRLSAGLSHTAFVDQEGVLWTWGSNQSGQLGAEPKRPEPIWREPSFLCPAGRSRSWKTWPR